MIRRLVAIALLAAVAACSGNITAADDSENRGGTMVTAGG
jgi:hypothetical protein